MYIHERNNWTDFRWNTDKILPLLGNVRHLQGNLLGKIQSIGFQLIEKATLLTLTLDTVDTSKIEGEFLNASEVRSSIARKLGIKNADFVAASRNVEGIVDVLLDATQNYSRQLTETRLFGWHNSLFQTGFSGYRPIDVAKYRSEGMKVVSGNFGREKVHFEAPAPDRVKPEMDRFLEWFNAPSPQGKAIDAVLKAAVAHLWFVTIHPFDDGNGRLARAIMDMQLARSDNSKIRFYSMSNQIYREHKRYSDLIEQVQKSDGDMTDWLRWFLECFERALLASEQNLKLILDKARFWDAHRDAVINDRQRLIINYFYDNYDRSYEYLRTKVYAELAECSTDTALRDLQDLVGKKMLLVEDSGKKTNYLINSPANIRIPKRQES
ncbi:MAG: Fic family protein [Prevotellaceae bacterium]|jgi:Fic family protein|nr:Fic family protein [Prevotellaceae bacterium]